MKKLVSSICVLCMVFSCFCLSVVSAEETTYTKTIDFDTVGSDYTPVSSNKNNIVTGSGVLDYSTVDPAYTDGNVMKIIGKQYQDFGIALGDVLKGKKVKTISFDVWSDSRESFNYEQTGIGDSVNSTVITCKGNLGYTGNIAATTDKKTVTYDFSNVEYSKYCNISNAILRFKIYNGNVAVYFDNIVITYEYFSGKFTGAVEADRVIYSDINGVLTTPEGTLAEGEFAGWVTEDDADNIIPAGTEVTITEDTTYFAVTANRAEQEAPAAPVLESKTSSSITLVANSSCEFSKDGVTWQTSNVFDGLKAGTEYTFYQRLKATPIYKVSPASPALKAKTDAVYEFEAENATKTATSGKLNTSNAMSDGNAKDKKFVLWEGTVNVGGQATFKFTDLVQGKYKVDIYSRSYNNRSTFDLSVADGTGVSQSLGSIDFTNMAGLQSGSTYYTKYDIATQFDVTDGTSLTFTLEMTKKGTGTQYFYIDKFVLTKVGELVTEDPLAVDVSMQSGASIRLGAVNGIRFYTNVDTAKIAELKADGATVEMGTLIAPADIIDGKELNFDLESNEYVNVRFTADEYYTENGFEGIVGSIVGIKETSTSWSATSGNITRNFVGRGYVKVTKDGKTTISYAEYSNSDISENTRSLQFVANAFKNDSAKFGELTSDIQALVNGWAGSVK